MTVNPCSSVLLFLLALIYHNTDAEQSNEANYVKNVKHLPEAQCQWDSYCAGCLPLLLPLLLVGLFNQPIFLKIAPS